MGNTCNSPPALPSKTVVVTGSDGEESDNQRSSKGAVHGGVYNVVNITFLAYIVFLH